MVGRGGEEWPTGYAIAGELEGELEEAAALELHETERLEEQLEELAREHHEAEAHRARLEARARELLHRAGLLGDELERIIRRIDARIGAPATIQTRGES